MSYAVYMMMIKKQYEVLKTRFFLESTAFTFYKNVSL